MLIHCGGAIEFSDEPVVAAPDTPTAPTPESPAATDTQTTFLAGSKQHSLYGSYFGTEMETSASANFQLISAQFAGAENSEANISAHFSAAPELPAALVVRGLP